MGRYFRDITPAHKVEVEELSAATYDDVQDFINQFGNRTHITGMVISDNYDGTVAISAGTGWAKITDGLNVVGKFFDFAGGDSDDVSGAMTDDAINYIYLDYHAGTPQIVHDDDGALLYDYDHIVLGCAFMHTNHCHIINSYYAGLDTAHQTKMQIYERSGGAMRTSGLITSDTGTRQLAITAGIIWVGLSRLTSLVFDTSSVSGTRTADATEGYMVHDADASFTLNDVGKTLKNTTSGDEYAHVAEFIDSGQLRLEDNIMESGETYVLYDSWNSWYYDGNLGGGADWVKTEHVTQLDNANWNDVSTGLDALTSNRYAVHWLYIDQPGKRLQMVYGVGDYVISGAETAGVPASMPSITTSFGLLIAKIIIQQGQSTPMILYPWTSVISSSLSQDHGSLAGLTHDDHTQYVLRAEKDRILVYLGV